MLTSNYYGDLRLRLLGLTLTLTSAFTCAWRNFSLNLGQWCLLSLQLSFWDTGSPSLKIKAAGIRLRVGIGKRELFHHTVLPTTNWHWHYKYPWRRKYLGWILNPWNRLVYAIAKRFVDRRYSKKFEVYQKRNANRWAGITGNALLEFKPLAIPSVVVPAGLTAKLTGSAPTTKCFVQFQLCGEPTAEGWRKSWEERGKAYPFCNVSLFIDDISDIKEDKQLSSYGGELWPSAWPDYFRPSTSNNKNTVGAIYLTAKGADLLLTAIR